MAEFPALPLWTDAWVADTKHLGRAERGMYHDLLVLMWRSPGCKVPNDEAWLATRLDIRENVDAAMLQRLIAEFCKRDGNWIWQKRLMREYEYCKKQSDRAKSRWRKEKDRYRDTAAASCPTPTPTPTIEEDIVVARARDARRLALDTEFNITFWPAYPLKIARKAALEAFYTARGSASLTAIMAGLESYSALLKGPDPPRAKHASGWLNGERWTDDNTPQVNGAQHDRRNGHAPSGKLGPGDATFAGFAIALDKAERRDRELEQAANCRADSNTTQSLLASERHTRGAEPSGRRLDRRP